MAIHFGKDPFIATEVMKIVTREREQALSAREWNFRLAGYGYAIEETAHGKVVTTVPNGEEICDLPEELSF
ncbi:MAG: hypothetical protein ABJL99_07375 [Aliishimia sp.]